MVVGRVRSAATKRRCDGREREKKLAEKKKLAIDRRSTAARVIRVFLVPPTLV